MHFGVAISISKRFAYLLPIVDVLLAESSSPTTVSIEVNNFRAPTKAPFQARSYRLKACQGQVSRRARLGQEKFFNHLLTDAPVFTKRSFR